MSDKRSTTDARLGQRQPVVGLAADVLLTAGRWRKRTERVRVKLENLSVTGMGFVTTLPEEIVPGRTLDLELDSLTTRVRVRHMEPVDSTTGSHYFGVEFAEDDPEAMALITRQMMGIEEAEKDRIWREGRLR